MTLVANFSIRSLPILLGDLLISRWFETLPNSSAFNIPTLRDVNSEIPEEWGTIAVALRQKVTILSGQLAIAWAGSQICASLAIREIEASMVDGAIGLDRIEAILGQLDLGRQDLFLTGLHATRINEGAQVVAQFAWDSNIGWTKPCAVVPGIGNIYAGGTGASDFLRVLGSVAEQVTTSATVARVETVIGTAASITAILSGNQMRVGAGLSSLYGGGFELATVVNGHIKKVDGITHFFMDAVRLENGCTRVSLRRAITYSYEGDVLLVGTLELQMEWEYGNPGDQMTLTTSMEAEGDPSVYVIFPVHRSPSKEECLRWKSNPPVLEFDSKFTAIYVHLPQRGGLVKTLVHYSGTELPAIGFKLGDGHSYMDMRISTIVLTKISNMLSEKDLR